MGNAPSDAHGEADGPAFSEALRFKEELGDMQRTLQALRVAPSRPLLPHQLEIDGVVVTCEPEVCVLLGPVIGRVEFQTARVLLEVSGRGSVTCHVSALNAISSEMAELPQCRCTRLCEPDRPAVFRIARLAPGHDYRICFSGLDREDTLVCRGSFRTPSLESGSSDLRAIAVSGDNPADLEIGERNLWANVRKRVERDGIDLILHLGGQVAMQSMFDYGCMLLLRHANSQIATVDGERDWKAIEVHAIEVMRDAYRSQWSMSRDLQFVLANTSNLMMWSDADVYPQFTTRKEFYIDHDQPTLQMQVIRTATRCARRLFHEYQRQLWDDQMDQLLEREVEMIAVAESALESAGKTYKLSLQIPKVAQDLELQKQRRDIEGARRVEKQLRSLEADKLKLEKQLVSFNQLLEPQRGEEFVYNLGSLSILLLDTRSARIEPGGSQAADNPILSPTQWGFIDQVLEQSETRMVVVCTESPLIDNELLGGSPGHKGDATAWSNNSDSQARLLAMLFEWKLEQPNRQFALVAGGGHYGLVKSRSKIKDLQLRTDAFQYAVGQVTAGSRPQILLGLTDTSKLPSSTLLTLHNNRFQIEHSYSRIDQKGFAIVSLKSGLNTDTPSINVEFYDLQEDSSGLARVVLGPVVGWVDHKSATILLELDRDADVACVLTNPLTGESRRIFQRFRANQPNSFHLSRLRSEHFYRASFTNITEPQGFLASFTTLAIDPERFNLVAVCNDNPQTITVNTSPENTGGQFFPDESVSVREALILSDEYLREGGDMEDFTSTAALKVRNKLKQLYRLGWTAPGVREKLANGAHIILSNTNDFLSDISTSDSLFTQRFLQKIHSEYFNLLLPPIMRCSWQAQSANKSVAHQFGKFGIFVLNLYNGTSVQSIDDDVWKRLDIFLSEELLQVLILVTSNPIVDHSTSDLLERARVDDSYHSRIAFHQRDLVRLLRIFFAWQQSHTTVTDQSGFHSSKHVVFLSGSGFQSFDSVIQDFGSFMPQPDAPQTTGQEALFNAPQIHQLVVGPLCLRNIDSFSRKDELLFYKGSLFNRYIYTHTCMWQNTDNERETGSANFDQNSDKEASKALDLSKRCEPSKAQFLHVEFSLPIARSDVITDINELHPLCQVRFLSECDVTPRVNPQDNGSQYSTTSITHQQARPWKAPISIPQWLKKLMTTPPNEGEQAGIDLRTTIIQEKSAAITTTFGLSPMFVSGSLSYELDPRAFVSELTKLFSEFHEKLGGDAVREYFTAPPSSLAISLILIKLLGDQGHGFSALVLGDASAFEFILLRCFIDGWLLNERLGFYKHEGNSGMVRISHDSQDLLLVSHRR